GTMAAAERAGMCVLRDGSGSCGSRGGPGDHHCAIPHPRNFEHRSGEPAQTMTPNLHLWLIPILPLIGAAINGLFGKRFSRRAVAAVALTCCGAAVLMAVWDAAQVSCLSLASMDSALAPWLGSGSFGVSCLV